MKLNFKSVFAQSSPIIKTNIREIIVLTLISSFFIFLTTKMTVLIDQVKDLPTFLLALFAAFSPIFFIFPFLLLLLIVINKESGVKVSYLKMLQYISTRLVALFTTNVLNGIIVFVGFLLLIVPGIIWYFTYSQAYLFTLIDGMSPMKSLKASKQATNKNKMKLLVLLFLFSLVYWLPIQLLSIFHIPAIVKTVLEVFTSYLFVITNYVIWKTLKQNMIQQNPA